MSQAIEVKLLGPTTKRGSRLKATCAATWITRDYDYELSAPANAKAVAMELAKKQEWRAAWVMGVLVSGDYVFVAVEVDTIANASFISFIS